MEESKVKTAEEVTVELKILIRLLEVRSNTYNLFGKKHFAFEKSILKNLHTAGIFVTDIDTQSHITKLEARNKELEEQVAELKDDLSLIHNYTKTHIKDSKVLVIISKISSKHLSK